MAYITAVFLYILFSITSMFAGVVGFAGLLIGRTRYIANVMHSMDMLLAAMLGWDGRSTVSKECGREIVWQIVKPCRFCRVICRLLDFFIKVDHCKEEVNRT
jgi:hypothetical protein